MTSRLCNLCWLLGLALVLGAGRSAPAEDKKPAHDAVTPVSKSSSEPWMKRHESFLARAKKGDVDVLFLGDSITQGWEGAGKEVWKDRYEPLKAANFGISGDRTQHVLWRLQNGELENIRPKAVVLMIGTNNMSPNSVAEIADGVTAIIHELRHKLPHSQVLLLGIFPRAAKATDKVRDKIKDTNKRIAKLDDGKHVRYLDIGEKFLDKDGDLPKETMPDFLHLSAKGYQIWADAIGSALNEMLKK